MALAILVHGGRLGRRNSHLKRKKHLWESGWTQLKVQRARGQLSIEVLNWRGKVWAGGKGRNGEGDPPPFKFNLSFLP